MRRFSSRGAAHVRRRRHLRAAQEGRAAAGTAAFRRVFRPVARLLREAGVQGIDVEELLARLPPVSEAHLRRKAARRDPPRGRSSLPRRAPRAPAHEEGQGRAETRPRNDQEHLSALRGCLNQAVEDGLLPANPAARLGKLLQAREEIRKQADPLTAEELSAVLAACRDWSTKLGRADTRRWFYPFILALARTGLRLGETVALQWGDLDFHNRSILIRAELHGRSHDDAEERQGARGRDVGRARRRAQGRARDGAAMLDSDNFRRNVWAPLLRKLGLRHRRIHDLRHTFAVLHLQEAEAPCG